MVDKVCHIKPDGIFPKVKILNVAARVDCGLINIKFGTAVGLLP
jgi:hypothetical protein